jgi:hypothetical protein
MKQITCTIGAFLNRKNILLVYLHVYVFTSLDLFFGHEELAEIPDFLAVASPRLRSLTVVFLSPCVTVARRG